ncbi:MAG: hypothetical protein AAB875_07625 [Patescibacteria group bacterium]
MSDRYIVYSTVVYAQDVSQYKFVNLALGPRKIEGFVIGVFYYDTKKFYYLTRLSSNEDSLAAYLQNFFEFTNPIEFTDFSYD